MSEVFGKTAITSREFPILLFDAGGCLFHYMPTIEKFYAEQLRSLNWHVSDEEIQAAMVHVRRRWNDEAEADEEFEVKGQEWPLRFVAEIAKLKLADKEMIAEAEKTLRDQFHLRVKVVVPQLVVEVCQVLRDRGYRLGIVSNGDPSLSEMLREVHVLDHFQVVVTAKEAGYAKPRREIFEIAREEMGEGKAIHIGSQYASDLLGAKRAGFPSILYDPLSQELRALYPDDTSGKVISLDSLRHNRRLKDCLVITQFDEILRICQ